MVLSYHSSLLGLISSNRSQWTGRFNLVWAVAYLSALNIWWYNNDKIIGLDVELIALTQCFIHVLLCSSYQVSVFLKHLHFHTNQSNLLPDMLTYSAPPPQNQSVTSVFLSTQYMLNMMYLSLCLYSHMYLSVQWLIRNIQNLIWSSNLYSGFIWCNLIGPTLLYYTTDVNQSNVI